MKFVSMTVMDWARLLRCIEFGEQRAPLNGGAFALSKNTLDNAMGRVAVG
jgi:hypothetical protein